MKVHFVALLIVVALTGSMAIVAQHPGSHSTPGIWLAFLNLPGTAVAAAIASRIGAIQDNDYVFYFICAPVNWGFYFYLIKGAAMLRSKLSN